jgi:hypothetical protein
LANLFSVPNFIKAVSPIGLRRLMFEVQKKDKTQYEFFNIQFNNGFWFVWYRPDPKSDTDKANLVRELGNENGISKG